MGSGFAFPRRFSDAETMAASLARNNRALAAYLNGSVVTREADGSVVLPSGLVVTGGATVDSLGVSGNIEMEVGSEIGWGSDYNDAIYSDTDNELKVKVAGTDVMTVEAGGPMFVGRVLTTRIFVPPFLVSAGATLATLWMPNRPNMSARINVVGPCGFHSKAVDAGFGLGGAGTVLSYAQKVYCPAAKWSVASASATTPCAGQAVYVTAAAGSGDAHYRGHVDVIVASITL